MLLKEKNQLLEIPCLTLKFPLPISHKKNHLKNKELLCRSTNQQTLI